jgi:hypothetical protein
MSKGNLFDFFVRVAGSTTTEDEREHSSSAAAMEPLTLTSPPLRPTTSAGLAPSPGLADAAQDVEFRRIVEKTSTKRKYTCMNKFGSHIKSTTGLDLLPAPDRNGRSASQCGTCLVADPTKQTIILNVTQKWNKHAKSCPGLKKLVTPIFSAEAQNMVMHVTLGGDKHRKNTIDAYVTTYWIYKHKLTFTTGDKLREVCVCISL